MENQEETNTENQQVVDTENKQTQTFDLAALNTADIEKYVAAYVPFAKASLAIAGFVLCRAELTLFEIQQMQGHIQATQSHLDNINKTLNEIAQSKNEPTS